jgi:hypothetical protein
LSKISSGDIKAKEGDLVNLLCSAQGGPGEDENDGHLYAHLNEVHTDNVNQKETGF